MIRELEFKLLCRRHCDEIYRYARSFMRNSADAEDVTQEVLLRLWQNMSTTRFVNARAWLLRTTRNYCLDQIRRLSHHSTPVPVDDEVLSQYPDDRHADPSVLTDSRIAGEQISQALQELPEVLRSVFFLYEVNGLRYREIAETLGIPINSVKVHLLRARKRLQQLLTREEPCMTLCRD